MKSKIILGTVKFGMKYGINNFGRSSEKDVFSILEYAYKKKFSLVLSKTVLIHINPNRLNEVYDKLYMSSKKYILIAEYYNPVNIEIKYRGFSNKLFKRDFAGEILKKYNDLELIDYGFRYHGDNTHKQDDINWFLLKKKN